VTPGRTVRRTFLRRTLLVVGVLALLLASVGWARLTPWRPVARVTATASGAPAWTAVNQWGVNTFLASEVEAWKRDKTLDMIQAAGVGWIKQSFAWNEIEPQPGVYWNAQFNRETWQKYDEIVDHAAQRGIRTIARLDQTPAWARAPGTSPSTPPTDPVAFGDFVDAFVRHFGDRVSFIQVWNEPNLAAEWGGAVDPAGYTQLLRIAATRARAANPGIVVLSAPLAMTNENSARAWNELRYWQALYDLGAARWFDIMTANAYGLDRPFDDPPAPETLNFRRLELLRDLEVQNGDADKPIWLDEYGWNAAPADFPADKLTWSRVSDDQQAAWTVGGLRYAREHWPWLGVANIWYFRQVGDIPTDRAEYYFRMVDVEFAPRDVYTAVQQATRSGATADVGESGDLAHAIQIDGDSRIVPASNASDGEYLMVNAGAHVLIHFKGTSLNLAVVPGATRGRLRVRVADGKRTPARSDPLRIVDLQPGASSVDVVGSSAPDATQRTRTAEITIDDGSALALDGVTVAYTRSYLTIVVAAAVGIAALLMSALLSRPGRGMPAPNP
jgi:hypothetical protein